MSAEQFLAPDTLTIESSEPLKSLGEENGKVRVGAYAIRFSGPEEKDLTGDYFTKSCDFGPTCGDGVASMFNHGMPLDKGVKALADVAEMIFGPVKTIKDDIGIFVEATLDKANEYEKAIAELCAAGKLKWSSGSSPHIARKNKDGEITRWHISEVSYTPQAAEPRLPNIMPLKSLDSTVSAEILAAFSSENIPATPAPEPVIEAPAVDITKTAKPTTSPLITVMSETATIENPRETEEAEMLKVGKHFKSEDVANDFIHLGKSLTDLRNHLAETRTKSAVIQTVTPEAARNGNYSDFGSVKSVGIGLVESDAYKSVAKGSIGAMRSLNVFIPDVKATVLTSTGPFTSYDRPPGIVLKEQQRLTIRDLLSAGNTNANSIRYMQEDTYTNAAGMVTEEGLKPEASFDLSEVDAPIRKIAVIGRVSDESFADFPMLQSYVDQRLRFMLKEREEAQLLNGTGAGANLTGLLQTSGIQTQAKGTDQQQVALYKAITKVRAIGKFEPSGIVLHPNDYQAIRLTSDANTQFYGGGAFYAPYGNGMVNGGIMPLWGLPCVVTTAITEGTALVGAFNIGAMIFDRLGVTVDTTNSDASDFQYNRIAIRVEERLGLVVWRPLAFCRVTGLNA